MTGANTVVVSRNDLILRFFKLEISELDVAVHSHDGNTMRARRSAS